VSKGKIIGLIAINFILFLVAFRFYEKDYYQSSISSKMIIAPGAEEYVTWPGEGEYHIKLHDTGSFDNICIFSKDKILKTGEYVLVVEYQANKRGTLLQVWDTKSYNSDNTRGGCNTRKST